MFILTFSGKKLSKILGITAVLLIGIAIGVFGIISAVNTRAYSRKLPIYSVDRGDNKIALTFDAAWGNSNTGELIEILAAENITATFFVTGEWCDKYPDDVRKFHEAGHTIGNHSDKHPHIVGMNTNDLIKDANECARKIKMLTGTTPTLYRTPYGEYDDMSLTTLEGMGYKVIQWDVDSVDWKDPKPAEIVKKVTEKTQSGSILLFHNDKANTTEALPEIIAELKRKGYEFASVSDLIYYDNYQIDHEGKQIYEVRVEAAGKNIAADGGVMLP